MQTNYYLLIGKDENWETSLKENIWGFRKRSKKYWEKLQINDLLVFYVTSPTKKIVGFGKITDKFHNTKLVWKLEKYHKEVIWPYKISFEKIHLCKKWNEGISLPKNMILQTTIKQIDKELFFKLVKSAELEWNIDLPLLKH